MGRVEVEGELLTEKLLVEMVLEEEGVVKLK